VHRGERQAVTAEQLMRARYSAYAVGNLDYVWQSWHPRTRPMALTSDDRLTWIGLKVLDTVDGRPQD
jgi:SEC-C motif-containing protein